MYMKLGRGSAQSRKGAGTPDFSVHVFIMLNNGDTFTINFARLISAKRDTVEPLLSRIARPLPPSIFTD